MTKGKARNLILFGFIFLILPFLFSVLNLYTDWLFFTETGYTSVFLKTLSTKISTGIFFGIAFLAFVLANITIANRTNFPQREISAIEGVINPFKAVGIEQIIKPLSLVVAFIMAIFAGQWGALRWEEFLLFKNSLAMGINDPLLSRGEGEIGSGLVSCSWLMFRGSAFVIIISWTLRLIRVIGSISTVST